MNNIVIMNYMCNNCNHKNRTIQITYNTCIKCRYAWTRNFNVKYCDGCAIVNELCYHCGKKYHE